MVHRFSLLLFLVLGVGPGVAQPAVIPSPAEVADLLRREPITPKTWPGWRERLLGWITDRSRQTDEAYNAARGFMKAQASPKGELPPSLSRDAFAWYLLGSAYLFDGQSPNIDNALLAQRALQHSLKLDPSFARAHRNLAWALMQMDQGSGLFRSQIDQELKETKRLDPSLHVKGTLGLFALQAKQFGDAERYGREALTEEPDNVAHAHLLAQAILKNPNRPGKRTPPIAELVQRFPTDGSLVCLHAIALALDGQMRESARELHHARQLGVDPTQLLSAEGIAKIESEAAPGWLELLLWGLGGFAAFYAAVMLLMTVAGVILAGLTRGSRALELLGAGSNSLVAAGQVVRTRHESMLTTLYGLALLAGLVLFYLAIPFILLGLLGGTAALVYLIFQADRIPIKLVVLIVVVGLGAAWAVLKSLFAAPGKGSFGLPKTAEECPRLHQLLAEVAGRVDTEPVHEVYLAPGSSIGVHQEGRGPFGVFGVKSRVLTLGVSTLRFLTVEELKAILAHEYAHFSHKDTFYSRFIYQVGLSIQQALDGMASSSGNVTYVNPFYWFLYLYHKAYSVLSAGFSRSREFLADRMASSLYGSDVFASALTKVCTDGTLFEQVIYDHISSLLQDGKAFVNMYEAFRSFRDEQLAAGDREELYKKLLDEKASLLADHPTFGERIAAVAPLAHAEKPDISPATSLFENAEEIEKELTEFMTGYMQYLQHLHQQVAAAQQ